MAKRQLSNFENDDINPCIRESKLSMQCLENELYNYSKCQVFFENYRNCKKFWGKVCQKRKSAGIVPQMPTREERDRIFALREKGIHVISAKNENNHETPPSV